MILFDYLEQNKGMIKGLMKLNVVPVSVIFHIEIYNAFKAELKTEVNKTIAIQSVADKHKISERTVFRIVRRMEQKVMTN